MLATLSEDDSSWKASGVKRRDFQHSHNGPEEPKRSGKRKKKNTKKWCRGKEGRVHEYKFHEAKGGGIGSRWAYRVFKCSDCGKKYFDWSWDGVSTGSPFRSDGGDGE